MEFVKERSRRCEEKRGNDPGRVLLLDEERRLKGRSDRHDINQLYVTTRSGEDRRWGEEGAWGTNGDGEDGRGMKDRCR